MKADTALILGNGPSLDEVDPAYFDRVTTFGVNRVHRKFREWERECDNIVITDHARIREIGDSYRDYGGRMFVGCSHNIYPRIKQLQRILCHDFTPLKQMVTDRWRQRWLSRMDSWPVITRMVRYRKGVSFDFERGFNFGGTTVGTAAQIAVALGFKRVLLAGVDAGLVDGKTHFGGLPHYPPQFRRQFPENVRLKLEPFFVLFQVALEETECELIDCTVNGKLRFVSKGRLEDYV